MHADGADLDALETEARGIKAELETRKEAEAKKAEIKKRKNSVSNRKSLLEDDADDEINENND